MKTIFIPAKSKQFLDTSKLKNLPKNIAIFYSIQYKNQADKIKKSLSEKHSITKYAQVLGCSKPIISKKTQALLLISDGKFHAIGLAYETKLPVYLFSHNKLEKISQRETESLEKKQKGSYLRFLNETEIGVLVSTKPGQENLEKALNLKNKHKNKKFYFFLSNNLDTTEFQNFGLNSWINTSCPRLDMNTGSIININKI